MCFDSNTFCNLVLYYKHYIYEVHIPKKQIMQHLDMHGDSCRTDITIVHYNIYTRNAGCIHLKTFTWAVENRTPDTRIVSTCTDALTDCTCTCADCPGVRGLVLRCPGEYIYIFAMNVGQIKCGGYK